MKKQGLGLVMGVVTVVFCLRTAHSADFVTPDSAFTFSSDGITTLTSKQGLPKISGISCVATQPDGKIVIVATDSSLSMPKLTPVDPIDKIGNCARGLLYESTTQKCLPMPVNSWILRLNSDGSLDSTFTGSFYPLSCDAIAILKGGSIAVGGSLYGPAPNPKHPFTHESVVLMVSSDGDGSNIYSETQYGAIVDLSAGGDDTVTALVNTVDTQLQIKRFKANGNSESAFGQNGTVLFDVNMPGNALIDVQSDGGVVLGYNGSQVTKSNDKSVLLTDYTAAGIPNQGFGSNGVVKATITGGTHAVTAIAEQSDHKLLTAGAVVTDASTPACIFVQRFLTSGALDTSFNTTGSQKWCDASLAFMTYPMVDIRVAPNGNSVVVARNRAFPGMTFSAGAVALLLDTNGSVLHSVSIPDGDTLYDSNDASATSLLTYTAASGKPVVLKRYLVDVGPAAAAPADNNPAKVSDASSPQKTTPSPSSPSDGSSGGGSCTLIR